MQWRHLGPSALVEDDSHRARSSTTANLRVGRKPGRDVELTLDVFNLLDRQVNDIEYFHESRLPPVADRHVHPAEPRSARLTLKIGF